MTDQLNVENSVRERYSAAAEAMEPALCCPVNYDPKFLKIIPQEVIERDYGCGDPSQYLNKGERVLDLGSGGGKICFIASQVVGESGSVIGVDMNDDMLNLARTSADTVAEKIGYKNVEFFKGKIEDLRINRDLLNNWIRKNPVGSEADLQALEMHQEDLAKNQPMIPSDSIDAIVSNCVLNLVDTAKKKVMFEELFRVLKRGGRAIISDIISDEIPPLAMQNDSTLWSGCISGAFEEKAFLKAFEEAGFYGMEVVKRDEKPWQVVDGIEFRSVTVIAYKGKEGECWDHNEALIYKGPFSAVKDDDGHFFERGERVAVCRKTFEIFSKEPYASSFEGIKPYQEIPKEDAKEFPCTGGMIKKTARQSKGEDYDITVDCSAESGCC
jgi:arsenite methyltransferase